MNGILLQLGVNALIAAAGYGLTAVGLSFIYTTTRIFHLAHGVTVLLAGYFFWWFWQEAGVNPVIAASLACLVAVAFGVLTNEWIYEPLRARKTRGLGFLIATIALLQFGAAALLAIFGSQPHSLGVSSHVVVIDGARITLLQMGIIGAAVLFLALTWLIVDKTRFGRAMRATADNEMLAEVVGIKPKNVRRFTFGIGSFLGAIAGLLIALEYSIDPNAGIYIAIKGFTAMVIGGVGSMPGAIVGSLILGFSEQAAVWFWGAGWKNAMAFALLFIFLLVRPQGLFGKKRFS